MAERVKSLTKRQKKLLAEIKEIAELSRLDYMNILDYDPEERTARLGLMKNQIVRSQVIADYTFVDEMLGAAICHYFFGKKRGFIKLWKTKKFKTFNHYILEVLSLPEKLRLVKAIMKIPKALAADIETLNALRNGLAHAFFPENLRSSKPIYKGKDIFTSEGLERFIQDMGKISDFFLNRNFGIRELQELDDRIADLQCAFCAGAWIAVVVLAARQQSMHSCTMRKVSLGMPSALSMKPVQILSCML